MIFIYLLAADGSFYLAHFLSHNFDFLWRTHAFHHTDNEVVFETHFRHAVTSTFAFFAVLVLACWALNLSVLYVGFAAGLVGAYQLLMHSPNWIWPRYLGVVFILPQYHRVHHTLESQRRNLGGMFSVWDRLFGTFSKGPGSSRYGLTQGHTAKGLGGLIWYRRNKP